MFVFGKQTIFEGNFLWVNNWTWWSSTRTYVYTYLLSLQITTSTPSLARAQTIFSGWPTFFSPISPNRYSKGPRLYKNTALKEHQVLKQNKKQGAPRGPDHRFEAKKCTGPPGPLSWEACNFSGLGDKNWNYLKTQYIFWRDRDRDTTRNLGAVLVRVVSYHFSSLRQGWQQQQHCCINCIKYMNVA